MYIYIYIYVHMVPQNNIMHLDLQSNNSYGLFFTEEPFDLVAYFFVRRADSTTVKPQS